MKNRSIALSSVVVGAGLVYLFDSASGPRRRARLRDRATHVVHKAREGVRGAAHDLANREHGLAARATGLLRSERAPDRVIQARARTALGRLTQHAGAIETLCHDGRIELTGDVLAEEHDKIVRGIEHVRGVDGVMDRLAVHPSAEGVPALTGERRRGEGARSAAWSPGTRLVFGVLGGGLLVAAAFGRGLSRLVPAILGSGLVARSVTNIELYRILRAPQVRCVTIEKTIHIAAPVERVFELFTKPEKFPHFMRHVCAVERAEDGRFRWTVEGPAGVRVSWTAELTESIPNERLAWRSVEPSAVKNEGVVELARESSEITRVHVRMTYAPPVGIVGHALASLFGSDPKHALDDDLLRMSSLLEEGKTTGREGTVTAK